MPEIELVDRNNQKVGAVEAVPEIFDVKVRDHLVQEYVKHQLARRRGGNACTISNRGDLSGGGKKPWRQKGTGRARAGSNRSPVWRGGLTVFGPTPRGYDFKLSKKARKEALKSVLTERLQNQRLAVVDQVELEQPKTKEAVKLLKDLGIEGGALFLLASKAANLELAIRNIPSVDVLYVEGLNVFDLLVHEKIICTPETLKKIEERLA